MTSRFPRRILFAADGSKESDYAREHVVDLAQQAGSEVHVVFVGLISPWTQSKTPSAGQMERVQEEAQAVLDHQLDQLVTAGCAQAIPHLRLGRATDEILRLRDEIDADLIVVGNRGHNAFSRILLGSDAEGVVRHAPCPVLVVRREAQR